MPTKDVAFVVLCRCEWEKKRGVKGRGGGAMEREIRESKFPTVDTDQWRSSRVCQDKQNNNVGFKCAVDSRHDIKEHVLQVFARSLSQERERARE